MARESYNISDSTDVLAEQDEDNSRKPDNTAFKQQRLPAWQPILSPKSVLPTFFIVGIIFIPIGAVLLTVSNNVLEYSYDYTLCNDQICSELRTNNTRMSEACNCTVSINVEQDMVAPVFVYYGLSNFFQNHRRYVKSRDDNQLIGVEVSNSSISSDCSPYRTNNAIGYDQPIAPCGAIANSLFNDTFDPIPDAGITIIRKGIAWPTDHSTKFKNPSVTSDPDNLTAAFASYAQPLFWQKRVENLDESDPNNNGYKNEAFEVWMRTAAFPTFRKLYGRIESTVPKGLYNFTVQYNYPVTGFGGRKRLILSTASFMGGKNSFLGIAYLVVGSCSIVVGVALCIVHFATKKNE
uniref:Cell cycle control protein n=1 Tax=Phallusia mammillata TaxID=59560 RepID=A0A6F9DUI2_9ASCI|nr:cell cycle control protein 50A-like [Phallusia mammillata]